MIDDGDRRQFVQRERDQVLELVVNDIGEWLTGLSQEDREWFGRGVDKHVIGNLRELGVYAGPSVGREESSSSYNPIYGRLDGVPAMELGGKE